MPPPDPAQVHDAIIAAHLQVLVSLSEWDVYSVQVKELEARHIEALCTATQDLRYEQGKIQGIREALHLPEMLIARSKGR